MNENQIVKVVVDAAIEVHRELGGPGLLEKVYEEALCYELLLRGLSVRRQVRVKVRYKQYELSNHLVLDILINDMVILEIKAVAEPCPIARAQLLTYLRISGRRLGLVINFGLPRAVNGIQRVVNQL